jgi:hypothetical protein
MGRPGRDAVDRALFAFKNRVSLWRVYQKYVRAETYRSMRRDKVRAIK